MTDNPISHLWDENIEKIIIGTLIYDFDEDCLEDINPAWFYLRKHQSIIQTMKHHPEAAGDIVALTDELKRAGTLNEIGGPGYLTGLVSASTYSSTYQRDELIERLHDYANRRVMFEIAHKLVNQAVDLKAPVVGTVGDAFTSLDNLAMAGGRGAEHWQDGLSALYDYADEKRKDPKEIYGVATGLVDFDKLTGGLEYGTTTLFAGAPGLGKSIISNQIGISIAKNEGVGVAMYSLEMRQLQLMMRCISSLAKIATYKIKSGKMDPDEWVTFCKTVDEAEQMPVYIYPHATLTTDELRADLKRLKVKHGVRAFVLDYIHLMTDDIRVQREDERSAYLSQRIQAITKDLDLIGITVDSVTKEGMGSNGSEPSLKNLRGSGQMLHDADNIFYMTQATAAPDFRELYLLKGRELTASGKARITLRKNPDYPLFENAVTYQQVRV